MLVGRREAFMEFPGDDGVAALFSVSATFAPTQPYFCAVAVQATAYSVNAEGEQLGTYLQSSETRDELRRTLW